MAERVVRCARCQDQRTVNGFGRCVVCGDIIADVRTRSPSLVLWHLRQNATGYAGVLLLGVSLAIFVHSTSGGALPPLAKMGVRLSLLAGGALVVRWIQTRLVG